MDKTEWTEVITSAMKEGGTYKEKYMPVIETLADILERRDLILAQWKKGGCKPLVTKTLDRGAKNKAKNPLLTILQEHEADALKYWSELGLTPKSLKSKLQDVEETRKSGSALVNALREMQRDQKS